MQQAGCERPLAALDVGNITEDIAEMRCSNLSQVAEGDLLRQVGSAVLSQDPHWNNHGRKYFPQALGQADACDASGSACAAGPGSPVSAQGGLPPSPLSGVRSAQKGEGWVVQP